MNSKRRRSLNTIRAAAKPGNRARGLLRAGHLTLPVSLGRAGIKANKREGDGSTPRGSFRLIRLWWRADRSPRAFTRLPVRRIKPDDGWCEDPRDRNYNRPVRVARGSSADRLHREDHLYDLIIELDHNTRPRITNLGSAVFIHFAREGFQPTAGCVGLRPSDLRRLLPSLSRNTRIEIA